MRDGTWDGLGDGHGHLCARQVLVRCEGRGSAARPRWARMWLPAPGGGVAPANSPAPVVPIPSRRPAGPPATVGPAAASPFTVVRLPATAVPTATPGPTAPPGPTAMPGPLAAAVVPPMIGVSAPAGLPVAASSLVPAGVRGEAG